MEYPHRNPHPGDRVRVRDTKSGEVHEVTVLLYELEVANHRVITTSGRVFEGDFVNLKIEILARPEIPWGTGFALIGIAGNWIYPEFDPEDEDAVSYGEAVMSHIYSPALYLPGHELGTWVTKCDLVEDRMPSFEVTSEGLEAWKVWSMPRYFALDVLEQTSWEMLAPIYAGPGAWKAGWRGPENSISASIGPWAHQSWKAMQALQGSRPGGLRPSGPDWLRLERRLMLANRPLCEHEGTP